MLAAVVADNRRCLGGGELLYVGAAARDLLMVQIHGVVTRRRTHELAVALGEEQRAIAARMWARGGRSKALSRLLLTCPYNTLYAPTQLGSLSGIHDKASA
jgi:hypothetical protein